MTHAFFLSKIASLCESHLEEYEEVVTFSPIILLTGTFPTISISFWILDVYTDEDDYWYTDALLQNYHNFSGKFNLLCGLPHLFSEDITKRVRVDVLLGKANSLYIGSMFFLLSVFCFSV